MDRVKYLAGAKTVTELRFQPKAMTYKHCALNHYFLLQCTNYLLGVVKFSQTSPQDELYLSYLKSENS